MFSDVWQAYRDEIVFAFTMLGCSGIAALGIVNSNTWGELLVPCVLAALPFAVFSRLRRFAPTALWLLVSALAVVGTGELIYRARYFGNAALTDFRAYSPLNVTAVPGFRRLASDRALQYTLTPGAETIANGDPVRINAQGFRDYEIAAAKPPGTFRIAVTGGSFVMGAFVSQEDRFTDQLAALLNQERQERFEVINLGLPGLALRDAAHLIERDAVRVDADLVLATMRSSQVDERFPSAAERPRMSAEDLVLPNFSLPRAHSFLLNIYRPAVRTALGRVRALAMRPGSAANEPQVELLATYPELLERAVAFTNEHEVPVAIVVLRKLEFDGDSSLRAAMARAVLGDPSNKLKHDQAGEMAAAAGLSVIDTYDAFPADARRSDLIVFPGDDHPNAIGHAAYARALADWIDSNSSMLGLSPR